MIKNNIPGTYQDRNTDFSFFIALVVDCKEEIKVSEVAKEEASGGNDGRTEEERMKEDKTHY